MKTGEAGPVVFESLERRRPLRVITGARAHPGQGPAETNRRPAAVARGDVPRGSPGVGTGPTMGTFVRGPTRKILRTRATRAGPAAAVPGRARLLASRTRRSSARCGPATARC